MNYNLRKEAEWQKSVREAVDKRGVTEYNEKEDAECHFYDDCRRLILI